MAKFDPSRHSSRILRDTAPKWLVGKSDSVQELNQKHVSSATGNWKSYADTALYTEPAHPVSMLGDQMDWVFGGLAIFCASSAFFTGILLVANSPGIAAAIFGVVMVVSALWACIAGFRVHAIRRHTWLVNPSNQEYAAYRRWRDLPSAARHASRATLDYAFINGGPGTTPTQQKANKSALNEFNLYCDSVEMNHELFGVQSANAVESLRQQRIELDALNHELREEREIA